MRKTKKTLVEKGRKKAVEKDRETLLEDFAQCCSAFLGNFCPSIGNMFFGPEEAQNELKRVKAVFSSMEKKNRLFAF